MELVFRQAKKSDLAALVQLMDQLGYAVSEEQLAKNLELYHPNVIVAEIDHQIVGCVALHFLPHFHSPETHMRVVSLIVDRNFRGKGIGKALLKQAEIRAEGCEYVELTSAQHRTGAHAFYRRQDYTNEETFHFRKRLSGQSPEKEKSKGDFGAQKHEEAVKMTINKSLYLFPPESHGSSHEGKADQAGSGQTDSKGKDA